MLSISVRRLFRQPIQTVTLAWAAGNSGADNRIVVEADYLRPRSSRIPELHSSQPDSMVVLAVSAYLYRLESGETGYQFGYLFDISMSLVIVGNGLPFFWDCATIVIDRYSTADFQTRKSSI